MTIAMKKTAMLFAAVLALSACQTTQEILQVGEGAERNPGPCPRAFALYDASRYIEFKDNVESYANVGFTGEVDRVRSLCRYVGERPINADLELEFSFGRGPAAESTSNTYEYFVAVTRKNIGVINKQTFPLRVDFPEGADRVKITDTIDRIIIPRAEETTSGENFEIIVGFNVTPEQRAFNAAGKRFRVSAGQTP